MHHAQPKIQHDSKTSELQIEMTKANQTQMQIEMPEYREWKTNTPVAD